jgi:hypothetical protein
LIYLCENIQSWNIINSSVNEGYLERLYDHHHIKSGNPSSPKKFEIEGLHNRQVQLRSKREWCLSWKFLTPSSNPFMLRNHFSLSSSSLRKALKNPFEEFLQYLLHSFPYPIISLLVKIDFLVKYGIYILHFSIKSFLEGRKSIFGLLFYRSEKTRQTGFSYRSDRYAYP